MSAPDRRRVGYVLKMYPRLAETFILNEILAHEAAGLAIEIFSLRSPIDGRFHEALSRVQASVTYVPGPGCKAEDLWELIGRAAATLPGGRGLVQDAAGEEVGNVYQAIVLAQMIQERGIGHLHAHFATVATNVARLAARLTSIPYTFTAHAKDIYHESVVDDDLRRKLRDAAAVVTVSDFNQSYLRDRFGGDAANVVRIYNGLDLGQFAYQDPRGRPLLILAVGRLVDKKGFDVLIDACDVLRRRGREVRCDIVGDGLLRDKLLEQIEQRRLTGQVRLLGARPRDEVMARMQAAAVLAVPCVISENGNRDGLPTVLLEAMALGTPCVSTDVTGIPEVIRDGETGLLSVQGDPESLAHRLERLLDDQELRVRIAERARALVEAEFDIHRNTPRIRALFAGALAPLLRRPVTLEVG